LNDRITFLPSQSGDVKQQLFLDHDLLVLPSYTEISPNTALEARATGLPVLLTVETGLSHALCDGMVLRPMRTPYEIAAAIREAAETYLLLAERSAMPALQRSWDTVADEHLQLFRNLV
jgi:glycosyltransferase involved in cell wall biosynthesis